MTNLNHLSLSQMEAGLPHILKSPKNHGKIELLVTRPETLKRQIHEEIRIDFREGVKGDIWHFKPTSSTKDGKPHPLRQVTVMNSRLIHLLAQTKDRWALAGDQIYADLDLSSENLPIGTQLKLGDEAIIEVSDSPHNGCKKFAQRYGADAMRFVNSKFGKTQNLRGINAIVIKEGNVKLNDIIKVL